MDIDNDITNAMASRNTLNILDGAYSREEISEGVYGYETPIFDSLAADRFASDRESKIENPAERRNHEFDRLDNYEEFNLGDYR